MDPELEEIKQLIAEPEPPEPPVICAPQQEPRRSPFARILGKILCVILETVLLLCIALYGVIFVLAKGPSPTARNLFVLSVRETSAVGFLANLFFTEAEIAQIENATGDVDYEDTDTSLIEIPNTPDDSDEPKADAWGLVDEDGDGIILEQIRGEGYRGYLMVVLDPSRVIMGSKVDSFGKRGYTIEQMVQEFDAVAGINAGGFYDPEGRGNGSIPDTMVVYDGEVYYPSYGSTAGFAGIDSNHILHVGKFTAEQAKDKDIQYGVGFGPVLISNGQIAPIQNSGVNPRTGIGQRSDGAFLLLVIEGRQVSSLGATYMDMAEIFLSYGAVNACNLDGGSSSMMWYNGEYVNDCASVVGIRPVPTSFLVLKKGGAENDGE